MIYYQLILKEGERMIVRVETEDDIKLFSGHVMAIANINSKGL